MVGIDQNRWRHPGVGRIVYKAAMDNTAKPVHLIETDPVEWTPEQLRDWIGECERLLAKLDKLAVEQALQSLRSRIAAELERKRGMLGEQQTGR